MVMINDLLGMHVKQDAKQNQVNAAKQQSCVIQGAITACLAVPNKASGRDEHYLKCHQCIIHSYIVDRLRGSCTWRIRRVTSSLYE